MSDNVSKDWEEGLLKKEKTFIAIKAHTNDGGNDELRVLASIFATYYSLFHGIENLLHRELDRVGLRKLLERTQVRYKKILRRAKQRNMSKENVFGYVMKWVEDGLFSDKQAVQRVFPYDIEALTSTLGLIGKCSSDALCEELSWEIQRKILEGVQEIGMKELFAYLDANHHKQLRDAGIDTYERLEISSTVQQEFLNTKEFWEILRQQPQNPTLARHNWKDWTDGVRTIRNTLAHPNSTISVKILKKLVDDLWHVLKAIKARRRSIKKMDRIRALLQIWQVWSDAEKVISLQELIDIFKLLRTLIEDDLKFRKQCRHWSVRMRRKRRTDRETLWPSLLKSVKSIFDSRPKKYKRFKAPKTHVPLSTASLRSKFGLDDETVPANEDSDTASGESEGEIEEVAESEVASVADNEKYEPLPNPETAKASEGLDEGEINAEVEDSSMEMHTVKENQGLDEGETNTNGVAEETFTNGRKRRADKMDPIQPANPKRVRLDTSNLTAVQYFKAVFARYPDADAQTRQLMWRSMRDAIRTRSSATC